MIITNLWLSCELWQSDDDLMMIIRFVVNHDQVCILMQCTIQGSAVRILPMTNNHWTENDQPTKFCMALRCTGQLPVFQMYQVDAQQPHSAVLKLSTTTGSWAFSSATATMWNDNVVSTSSSGSSPHHLRLSFSSDPSVVSTSSDPAVQSWSLRP